MKEKRVISNAVNKETWLSPSSVFGESTFLQEVDLFLCCHARWHTLHCGWQCSGGVSTRRSRWEVLSELQDHVQICPDSCTENQSSSIFFFVIVVGSDASRPGSRRFYPQPHDYTRSLCFVNISGNFAGVLVVTHKAARPDACLWKWDKNDGSRTRFVAESLAVTSPHCRLIDKPEVLLVNA